MQFIIGNVWFEFTVFVLLVLVSASAPLREAAEQTCLVWDLVVALWGKLKEEQEDDEGNVAIIFDRMSSKNVLSEMISFKWSPQKIA